MKVYLTLLLMVIVLVVQAQSEDASRRRNFNVHNDVAIREFDPVSYFKGSPAKGTYNIVHTYKGITYYFSSEENRDEFKKSPAKYEPAYGGWCAYTMGATGQKIKVDPSTYKISDGKLYLFHNFNGNNTLLKWNKNEDKLKASATKNWTKSMH